MARARSRCPVRCLPRPVERRGCRRRGRARQARHPGRPGRPGPVHRGRPPVLRRQARRVRADRVPARPDRTHHRHGDRHQPSQPPRPRLARTLTSLSALSGGGDPVTFDGEFHHVDGLDPAAAPAPRVFTGSVGPKSLAVTGQLADGWILPGGADWLSQSYRESRPRVDAAAAAAGRDPAEIVSVFNFGGRITPRTARRHRRRGRPLDRRLGPAVGRRAHYRRPGPSRGRLHLPQPRRLPRRPGPGPLGHRDRPRRPRSDHPVGVRDSRARKPM